MNRILIIDDDKALCVLIKQSIFIENIEADYCLSLIRRYTRFNHNEETTVPLVYDGLTIDMDTHSISTENGIFELPPKEFDLLFFLAKNQGKILTKQRIYEEVWGEPYVYDDSNIMAIISRLRKKLEKDSASPQFIQTVKGIGYRFNKEKLLRNSRNAIDKN